MSLLYVRGERCAASTPFSNSPKSSICSDFDSCQISPGSPFSVSYLKQTQNFARSLVVHDGTEQEYTHSSRSASAGIMQSATLSDWRFAFFPFLFLSISS